MAVPVTVAGVVEVAGMVTVTVAGAVAAAVTVAGVVELAVMVTVAVAMAVAVTMTVAADSDGCKPLPQAVPPSSQSPVPGRPFTPTDRRPTGCNVSVTR